MTWHTVSQIYMGLMLGAWALCALGAWLRREALEVFGAATVIGLMTLLSRVIIAALDPPWSVLHFPPQDLLMTVMCWALWYGHRERWKALLAVCFTTQLAGACWFWSTYAGGGWDKGAWVTYLWVNNGFFVLEWVILLVAGGRHVWTGLRHGGNLFRAGGMGWPAVHGGSGA